MRKPTTFNPTRRECEGSSQRMQGSGPFSWGSTFFIYCSTLAAHIKCWLNPWIPAQHREAPSHVPTPTHMALIRKFKKLYKARGDRQNVDLASLPPGPSATFNNDSSKVAVQGHVQVGRDQNIYMWESSRSLQGDSILRSSFKNPD